MRELRRSNDRMIAGVASGLAEYFDMDKTIWRAIWVVGCVLMPPAVLAYLILAIVIPRAPREARAEEPVIEVPPVEGEAEAPPAGRKRMTKSHDRWLSGVAGGIAEYFDVDPVLIRGAFLVSFFLGGAGLLVYIVLAILMPKPHYQYR